jgi:hypothetical protein
LEADTRHACHRLLVASLALPGVSVLFRHTVVSNEQDYRLRMKQFERPPWAGRGVIGTVLVLPGGSGGVHQSSLYWVTLGLAEAGWDLLVAVWRDDADQEAQVQPTARAGIAAIAAASTVLVVGKSLGSLAAPVVRDAGIPAVWLTPLLDRPGVADAVRSSAPALAVGGTADPTWRRPQQTNGLGILELPEANHGLVVPGDWRTSLRYAEAVVERALEFASSLAEDARDRRT